ncbi:hypothetical protein LINGRAHAP2_LOCUS27901 [Linum grandiflorum]
MIQNHLSVKMMIIDRKKVLT